MASQNLVHISQISVQRPVVRRVTITLPVNVKLLLYKTYILCHFNFCPLVWHFCGQSDTDKLESLQTRALQFVYSDYESDYDTLLSRANMPTLKLSRLRALSCCVLRCSNALIIWHLSTCVTFLSSQIKLYITPDRRRM